MRERLMAQEAPYPEELADLVSKLRYRQAEGWEFKLQERNRGQGSKGLTLVITRVGPDAYKPEEIIGVNHYMLVPPAAYNRRSWQAWLFDQIMLVEKHEAMENFIIDGHRPFAPLHGPGNDPYLITLVSTDEEKRTAFTGKLNPESP